MSIGDEDREYFRRRAIAERDQARRCPDARAAGCHLELALRYEMLVIAIVEADRPAMPLRVA